LLEALPNADIFPSWNSGGNRIFHCASKDESYLDTINEMLNKSISSNDDPLLLIKNRMKSYNLVSIKDMFNN
jgi:hypothetical protein